MKTSDIPQSLHTHHSHYKVKNQAKRGTGTLHYHWFFRQYLENLTFLCCDRGLYIIIDFIFQDKYIDL